MKIILLAMGYTAASMLQKKKQKKRNKEKRNKSIWEDQTRIPPIKML